MTMVCASKQKTEENIDFEIEFFKSIISKMPRYAQAIAQLSDLYTKKGLLDESLKWDRKLVRLHPKNPIALYNLACSLALTQQKAACVRTLQKALDHGYNDIPWLLQDPDFQSMRDYPAFLIFINSLLKKPLNQSSS